MSEVIFDDEQVSRNQSSVRSALGGVSSWLIQQGIVKDEKGANILMLTVAGVATLVAVCAPLVLTEGNERPLSPTEIQRIEALHSGLRYSR